MWAQLKGITSTLPLKFQPPFYPCALYHLPLRIDSRFLLKNRDQTRMEDAKNNAAASTCRKNEST